MGNNGSGRRHSSRKSLDTTSKKIDEKEYVFIALQAEIDRALNHKNRAQVTTLAAETAAHIIDLNQLKQIELPYDERGRCQRVLHNFELALAKLKSVLQSAEHVYVNNPDLVSDLVEPPHISRSNSLYKERPKVEEVLTSVEEELEVLKDKAQRSIDDVTDLYQMDKGVFYLQVQLENLDLHGGDNNRKYLLLKQLGEFRNQLDRKAGEMEEQRQIIQEVDSLEVQLDCAGEGDFHNIEARVLLLQETITKSGWDFNNQKPSLLERLSRILQLVNSQEEQETIHTLDKVLAQLDSSDEDEEDLYGNIEVIRQVPDKRPSIVDQAQPKRPLPLPRNYDDKVINELPRKWQRLATILEREMLSDTDKMEVAEIQRQAELARSLFERRIRMILDKEVESVDL